MTRASSGPRHLPVLADEVVQALAIARGETLVDGTFGAGGYTRAMLAAGAGRVIGFDRDPDAIALVFEDTRLTYTELDARANRLAHRLQSSGVGPDVLVGVCLERSLDLAVALQAVLKAGGGCR